MQIYAVMNYLLCPKNKARWCSIEVKSIQTLYFAHSEEGLYIENTFNTNSDLKFSLYTFLYYLYIDT